MSKSKVEVSRDYLFDNIRAILIILVVWGHVLSSYASDHLAIKGIYFFIYFFHMPAMSFISGYFSKNVDKARENAVRDLLIPYVVLNVFEYGFKMLILNEPYFTFRFFRPLWGLWYLFALFLWKFFLKDIVKIRFILPLSFLVGILSGFASEFGNYMSLGRTINFLPFFLLGYYAKAEHIEKIRKAPKWISIGIISFTAALSGYLVLYSGFRLSVFFMRKAYPAEGEFTFMKYRIAVYIVALMMIFALINLVRRKQTFLSHIGKNTLTVYVLHLFTVPIYEKFELFVDKPFMAIGASIILTTIITYIYSRPFVINYYHKFMNGIVNLVMKSNNVKEKRL